MVWIIGPCAIESEKMYYQAGAELAEIMQGKEWFFKGSFDKANRTSIKGKRGVGIDRGIKIFEEIKERIPGIQLITDVHEVYQVEKLVPYIDCIQIPAFLCRQTDLIVECARYFKKINIKKGQWIGVNNLKKSIDKIRETNSSAKVWITERGSAFGPYQLVVDFSIVDVLKEYYDEVILDCTHSTQRSKTVFGVNGDRILAERYLMAAPVFGYTGIFAEVHPNPDKAISDGGCQIRLDEIHNIITKEEKIACALRD